MSTSYIDWFDISRYATTMQKFGVFDIDGTLFRSQLYHEVLLEMARNGNLPPELATNAINLYKQWQDRKASFNEFEMSIAVGAGDMLPSINQKAFDTAVEKILHEQKDRVYMYTKNLISELKQKGYYLIAISGSHSELVEHFAAHHGFDEWIGQVWERDNVSDTFQSVKVVSYKDKHIFLQDIIEKKNLTLEDSYAVGDSQGDITMLDMVEHPIAFNPSKELLDHAKKKGWDIVIERKTIAYTLRNDHGTYILA